MVNQSQDLEKGPRGGRRNRVDQGQYETVMDILQGPVDRDEVVVVEKTPS
jgi:hypothetical protein